jgi:Pectate lyase superfamily protein
MGSVINGVYVPDNGEVTWGTSVSNNFRRQSENHFNVKAYGALGDGSHDDAPNIQAAIDAAVGPASGGGVVYFPVPTVEYKLTTALTIGNGKRGITFEGAGPGAMLAQRTAGQSIIKFDNASSPVTDIVFRNLFFNFGTKQVHQSGAAGSTRIRFENCTFQDAADNSVYFTGAALGWSFENCMFFESDGHIIHVPDGVQVNNMKISQCWFQSPSATTYVNLPVSTGGILEDWLFQRCLFQGPFGSSMTTTVLLGATGNIAFDQCHWADFTNTSTNKPLVKTAGGNSVPNNLTFTTCDMVNSDGPVLENPTGGAGAGGLWTFIGCRMFAKAGGGGPFLLTQTPNTPIILINCWLTPAQSSWGFAYLVMFGCFEAGVVRPLNIRLAGSETASITSTGAFKLLEQTDPTAPATNNALLYAKDNGSGKTQIVARFPTGAVQVIATEP